MAIVGGAIMPIWMGHLAAAYSLRISFAMPLIRFLCVMFDAVFWPALERLDTGHEVPD